MAQTREGAIKIAAARAGCSVDGYKARMAKGEKWCSRCRVWHERSAFGADRSRWDGLAAWCRAAKKDRYRETYRKKKRESNKGRSFVPARDDDRRQARRRINYFVEQGIIPHPNELPCSDCGHNHKPGGKRHEYDHHLGYAAENHEKVEAVCSSCHRKRTLRRGEWRPRSSG